MKESILDKSLDLQRDKRFDITFIDDLNFYFIIGKGRSGTTLLSSLLAKNAQILATHESRFMLVFYKKFRYKKEWTKKDIRFILKNLWIRQKLMKEQWQIDMSFLESLLFHHIKDLNYQRFCKIIYTCHCHYSNQIDTIIDKNPLYSFHIDKWMDLFPQAKFIVMVRDYRDQYFSMIADKLKPMKTNGLTSLWAYLYQQLLMNPSLHNENTLYVKFEDLIENKDLVINNILTFLDVSSKESIEQEFISTNQTDSKINELFYRRHQNVNRKIDKNNKNKWMVLPDKIILELEKYNAQTGKKFGYQSSLITDDEMQKSTSLRQKILIQLFSNYMYQMPIKAQKLLYDFGRFMVKQKNRL